MSSIEQNKTLSGEAGGAWTENTHELLHPKNFNKGLANYMCRQLEYNTVLEFGSGLGFLASHISQNKEIEAYHCIEPNQIKGCYSGTHNPRLFAIDIFEDSLPNEIYQKYDLVCSIEVAEHIEREKHEKLFDFLVEKSGGWIVFSGARIGQGGHGHIAERDENDWKSEFTRRQCKFHESLTNDIRRACDEKNINHRKNLMVFSVS